MKTIAFAQAAVRTRRDRQLEARRLDCGKKCLGVMYCVRSEYPSFAVRLSLMPAIAAPALADLNMIGVPAAVRPAPHSPDRKGPAQHDCQIR
jgi:hypothetical protein